MATASPNLPSCLPPPVSERREISLSFGLSLVCVLADNLQEGEKEYAIRSCAVMTFTPEEGATFSLSFPAREEKREISSLLAATCLCKGLGSVNNFFAVFSCKRRKERDAIHAGFILSCKRKRERAAIHAGFILIVQRGGGSVFFFLLCFFLSFSRLAFEMIGIFDLAS